MTVSRSFLHAFGGGEMSPEMIGRVDDQRRQQGAARIRNLIVTPQGPLTRRNGTRFVARAKNDDPVRLITFKFSADQALGVQVGPGYFRFLSQCATVLLDSVPRDYVTPKNISSGGFDGGTDQITFSAAHNLVTGDVIAFTDVGTTLPAEINLFQNYAVIVVSTTVIKIAVTVAAALAGTALNFTTSGGEAGRVHFVYQRRDLVRFLGVNFYCTREQPLDTTPTDPGTPISCTFAGNFVTTSGTHGFVPGTAVILAGAGLPPQVTAGVVYYVDDGTTTTTLALTEVYGSGVRISFSLGSGTIARANHWYALTDDIYEIPNDYTADDLQSLTWDSSFDVLTLAVRSHPPSELRRFGATSWEFVPVVPGQTIATPGQPTAVAEVGSTQTVANVTTAFVSGYVEFVMQADHFLADGDVVFWSGGGKINDGSTDYIGDGDFFYVVRTGFSATKFGLRERNGGAKVGATLVSGFLTVVGTITFRVTSLNSEQEHVYAISAVDENDLETSLSAERIVTNNLNVDGASNTLTWNAVAGAARYRIYKKTNGLFGFLGEVEDDGSSTFDFTDDNIAPDLGRTAPRFDDSLSGTDYPAATARFEQRRLFGGSTLFPQRIWGTRTGTESDQSFHIPVQDDDRIRFDIASREAEVIRHIVPLAQLLILTSASEYRVTPVNSDAITPTSIAVRPQTFIGASVTQPAIVNNTVVFAAERGGHVREMGFDSQQASYITGDLSLRSRHLFDGYEIRDLRLAVSPIPIVWAVSSSGLLLGLTYSPEEQIGSWHAHETTNGAFENCTVVSEGTFDNLYVSVARTIDGSDVRYIECIEGAPAATFNDSFFVDCGLTYSGAAATVISGLDHLEGETVVALADGVLRGPFTVAGGQITLPVAAVKVHVGLRMTSTLQTLPLLSQLPAFGQGNTKNIDELWVRVLDSSQFRVGTPSATGGDPRLVSVPKLTKAAAATLQVPVTVLPEWNQDGAVLLVQEDPLPWTLVCLTIRATAGG